VDFAQALKERRASRRLSQLELALKAGTTQRHLSFIESGRSVPGREMVIRLTESLGLPLRERNEMLLRAGYAPAYPEQALDSAALAPVMDALGHILTAHLPYPAIIVDRSGDIVAANTAHSLLFEGCAGWLLVPPVNAYRAALHPEGMAPRIANFGEWARHVLLAWKPSWPAGTRTPVTRWPSCTRSWPGTSPRSGRARATWASPSRSSCAPPAARCG
jgi:transcriptional regulator with XRE-family HTH domain